eukprot:4441073-Prorocentrum_lima.AAC.1
MGPSEVAHEVDGQHGISERTLGSDNMGDDQGNAAAYGLMGRQDGCQGEQAQEASGDNASSGMVEA